MNILILGGTQFVGKYIVSECLSRKHNITIFNRGFTNPNLFDDVEYLRGDRESGNFHELSDRYWDAVIDIPYFKPDVVQNTFNFLLDKVKTYAFISSVSVYDVDRYPNTDYDIYCLDKLKAERCLNDHETKTLIFRPGILCGDGDNTNRFDYKDDGIFWKHSNREVTDYTTVENFSKFVLNLIENGNRGIYEHVVESS